MPQPWVRCEQRGLPSIRTCFPLRPVLAHTHMSKGHAADGQQICINLAVHFLSIGPASTMQRGND